MNIKTLSAFLIRFNPLLFCLTLGFFGCSNAKTTAATTAVTTTPSGLCVANGVKGGVGLITVFDKTLNGNVAPARTIGGINAGFNHPSGLLIDLKNQEMFVGNYGAPLAQVFRLSDSGNVTPKRTLSLKAYGVNMLALDKVNDELIVASSDLGATVHQIDVYKRTDSGSAMPIRSIVGASTGLNYPIGVAVDVVNDEIIAANYNGGGSIVVHSRMATGNVAPLRTIAGATTQITAINSVFLDLANNEIYVVVESQKILVFSRTANGNVAPLRVISGASTLFSNNTGTIVVDPDSDLFYLADYLNDAIYSFPRTGSGNIAPTGTIEGGLTQLDFPWGIDLCPL